MSGLIIEQFLNETITCKVSRQLQTDNSKFAVVKGQHLFSYLTDAILEYIAAKMFTTAASIETSNLCNL